MNFCLLFALSFFNLALVRARPALNSKPSQMLNVVRYLNLTHLQFRKETINNYLNADMGICIERCQHYTILEGGKIVGNFYCGVDYSIGLLNETYLVIKRLKSGWTKRIYELQNFNNNVIVGQLSISNFVANKSLKISLDIIHRDTYDWEVLASNKGFSLFTSKTFSYFTGRLFNGQEKLMLKWDYKSNEIYKHKLEELPIEGFLELTNPNNHFLIFSGLFLAEMQLQMKAVD